MDYDEYDTDDDLESIPEHTREQVFQRDGEKCWLCEKSFEKGPKGLDIAHQINAVEKEAFARFKANGTIPDNVMDPSHSDNLFPLCPNCHKSYDAGSFPGWILIPHTSILEKYIQHERDNYEYRHRISRDITIPKPDPESLR
jgi:hypothetical protein